jgi:hypothetical protein
MDAESGYDRMNGSDTATARSGHKTTAAYRRRRDDDMAET